MPTAEPSGSAVSVFLVLVSKRGCATVLCLEPTRKGRTDALIHKVAV